LGSSLQKKKKMILPTYCLSLFLPSTPPSPLCVF
jgi:hypothetical protein